MIAAARDRGPTPPLPAPSLGPGILAAGDALAGHLCVQGEVAHAGRRGRFDDVAGRGFTLLSPLGDPVRQLTPELAEFFASLGGIGAHVAPGAPVDDVQGSYARWFREHVAGVVLQRPDFHVFGSAPTVDGAVGLVAQLRDALAHRRS
jgi:3-(3-hydroxy-phenyl)propionate hydroxylase